MNLVTSTLLGLFIGGTFAVALARIGEPAEAPVVYEENFYHERAAVLRMLDAERECVRKATNRKMMRACSI